MEIGADSGQKFLLGETMGKAFVFWSGIESQLLKWGRKRMYTMAPRWEGKTRVFIYRDEMVGSRSLQGAGGMRRRSY